MTIIEVCLADAATTAGGNGARLRGAPGKRLNVGPILMVRILRFAIGAIDFHEHIYCHKTPLEKIKDRNDERRSRPPGTPSFVVLYAAQSAVVLFQRRQFGHQP